MEHLIGDLLDMASIHVGKLKIERRSQSAEALLQEAVDPCDAMAAEQGLQFAARGASEHPRSRGAARNGQSSVHLCPLMGNDCLGWKLPRRPGLGARSV